jgi:hypothetical protein
MDGIQFEILPATLLKDYWEQSAHIALKTR